MKKIVSILAAVSLAATGAFGAIAASENASNCGGNWNNGDNFGLGLGAWTINNGDGGHYIGRTGLGANTFGVFNTFNTTTTVAIRPFTGVLGAGATFSIKRGFSTFAAAGSVGINLRSGTNEVITLFTTGSGDWMLNDGGRGDFSAGATASANSAYTFSLTYKGGTSYYFSLTESAGGINFNSGNGGISSIDNVRFFNFNQGRGANFGFDDLPIVPEPSSLALLAGPALLGARFFVRRRRTS
jgi:hypothetical protein